MTASSVAEKRRMLEIKNLSVSIEDKLILDSLSLSVNAGEVAAIMGPNGSGKSTLAYVLAGKPAYKVVSGEILLDGESLLELEPNERALKGLFLAFQYPVEIPGVAAMTFLKAALNAQRRPRGEGDLTTPDFMRRVRAAAQELKIDQEMLRRPLNVGFSGGEKKRFEVLQMALLTPRVSVLDETDSGLDIDALRVVAEGVNALRNPNRAFVIITHYQRLLDHIRPDVVHVMAKGRIVASGGPELALELERNGYRDYAEEAAEVADDRACRQSVRCRKNPISAICGTGAARAIACSGRGFRSVRRGRTADPAGRGLAPKQSARIDGRCGADPARADPSPRRGSAQPSRKAGAFSGGRATRLARGTLYRRALGSSSDRCLNR